MCLIFVELLRLCGSSAGSTTKFVPRLMVCWRCGQWVEDARWVRITGQCTARVTDFSQERLLAYYSDGAGDTWVTECHPSCEAQLLLPRIRTLRARFTPIPKPVSQDLADIDPGRNRGGGVCQGAGRLGLEMIQSVQWHCCEGASSCQGVRALADADISRYWTECAATRRRAPLGTCGASYLR